MMGDFFKETDVVCIGLGPFNLSLSVLLHEAGFENYIAIEQKESFSWHEGMLLEGTTLQVPFLADLSTMVNPRSEFTYLNYLHEKIDYKNFSSLKTSKYQEENTITIVNGLVKRLKKNNF